MEFYRKADKVIWLYSMLMTKYLEKEGKLTSLAVSWREGICYTSGRLPEVAAKNILGKREIPVLHSGSRLARMIMKFAHEEDHKRMPQDALFRSRKYAWIHRGLNLAKDVVKNCQWCAILTRELCNQRMAKLPKQIFEVPTRPFSNITMDFTGAFKIRSLTFNKRYDKVYPLVIVCMNTSAVNIEVCGGYATKDFLTAFDNHCQIRGRPKFCYTDAGSQLQRAKKEIAMQDAKLEEEGHITDELPDIQWKEVREVTAKYGIEWRIAPSGAQHRDGRSEAAVHALKRTMKHLYASKDLNILEFQNLLNRAANCINERPLAIYDVMDGEPGVAPLTPNLLLHNFRTESGLEPLVDEEQTKDKHLIRWKMVQVQYKAWWEQWMRSVFSNLVPYKRWKQVNRNLEVDDVCLLKYQTKVAPADYRLCRVVETYPDEQGLVRTVRIALAARDKRMKVLPHNTSKLVYMKVPVQRLVLIHAKEDGKEIVERDESVKVVSTFRVWPLLGEDWSVPFFKM